MRFVSCLAIAGWLMLPAVSFGQETLSKEAEPVKASVCEKLINGESRSSARIRASDKASFKAVEDSHLLDSYRSQLDTQKFNLKIYRLVDNHLENVKISTTEQSQDKVCVEVNALLSAGAVAGVFANEPQPEVQENGLELALEIEDDVDENISITIPPKPDIVINKDISYASDIDAPKSKPALPKQAKIENSDGQKTIVFIDKTEFYDGSATNGFFSPLEQLVVRKPDLKASATPENSDYVLKTKVLKAKVDNVNSETSRLQVVVSLELINAKTSESVTDHQNRFVLFNSSEDAQKVAANLTRKLFAAGIEKLLPKVGAKPSAATSTAIITPN